MADIGDVFTKTLAQEKAAAEGRKKREIAEREKALIEKSKFKEYLNFLPVLVMLMIQSFHQMLLPLKILLVYVV